MPLAANLFGEHQDTTMPLIPASPVTFSVTTGDQLGAGRQAAIGHVCPPEGTKGQMDVFGEAFVSLVRVGL